jgi:radical SAM protein with 4Fe4S-binding SPASM domain
MTRMAGCPRQTSGFEFSREAIDEAVKNSRLLTMEIEFSRSCNFRCPYCYVPERSSLKNELSRREIRDVILQAKELGARKIIILGGEPTIYPHILEMIRFIGSQGLEVEMFTNGSRITAAFAKQLFEERVRVVLKMNTFNKDIQEMLTGTKGSFELIQQAFQNLKKAGYPSEEAFLAVDTVVCRQNVDEIVSMWQWLRDQDIVPYFEMITPQDNAKESEWLHVDSGRLHELFAEIAELDRSQYGQIWDPQPPLLGNRCMRHKFSCLVGSQGDVMPCVGVNIAIGNIREQKLHDIIKDSEILEDLRDHTHTIKGQCRSCEKADMCYGCRGAAYQLTGDYLASDPLCWRNADRQDEISRLPIAVDEIIPQNPPMRMVDALLAVGDRWGEVSVAVSDEMPFVGEDGTLAEVAYVEMMAQSIAALNGFKQLGTPGSSLEGYLVGAQDLEILGTARVGDRLSIRVHKEARFSNFGVVKGTVSREDTVLARGTIKIWHDTVKSGEDTMGGENRPSPRIVPDRSSSG